MAENGDGPGTVIADQKTGVYPLGLLDEGPVLHAPLQVAIDAVNGIRADGVPLASASHPTASGLQSNLLVSANVSECYNSDWLHPKWSRLPYQLCVV
jgi:hypothetical protein